MSQLTTEELAKKLCKTTGESWDTLTEAQRQAWMTVAKESQASSENDAALVGKPISQGSTLEEIAQKGFDP